MKQVTNNGISKISPALLPTVPLNGAAKPRDLEALAAEQEEEESFRRYVERLAALPYSKKRECRIAIYAFCLKDGKPWEGRELVQALCMGDRLSSIFGIDLMNQKSLPGAVKEVSQKPKRRIETPTAIRYFVSEPVPAPALQKFSCCGLAGCLYEAR